MVDVVADPVGRKLAHDVLVAATDADGVLAFALVPHGPRLHDVTAVRLQVGGELALKEEGCGRLRKRKVIATVLTI